MKVVHISHTDGGAGAGRAAYRIHSSLRELGVDSRMLVSQKRTADPSVQAMASSGLGHWQVRVAEYLEARAGRTLARDASVFLTPARYGYFRPARAAVVRKADVVAAYWINGAYIAPESLAAINKPLVWRLSDVWPFTGGCHYPWTCERFESQCGECPQLRQPGPQDATNRLWLRKQHAWRALDLTVVAPSNWMAGLARRSSLFADRRVEVIPTGVDLSVFRPQDSIALRKQLDIPQDRLVIAFGALDPAGDTRKGYAELSSALERIAASPLAARVMALIFGRQQLPNERLPIPARFLGRLDQDQALSDIYSAADLVVVPSLEDNLPNVALEAIACGAPVCGFDVGGMPDIVRNGWNGFLAPLRDSRALADGMIAILGNGNLRREMSKKARMHAEQRFSLDAQAHTYAKLYAELVDAKRASGITQ